MGTVVDIADKAGTGINYNDLPASPLIGRFSVRDVPGTLQKTSDSIIPFAGSRAFYAARGLPRREIAAFRYNVPVGRRHW